MAVLADLVHRRWGVTPAVQTVDGRPNLVVAAEEEPQLLLLEHINTVWPHGTLDRWPFSVDGNRATGPGVFDMKAGLVQALHAVSALDAPPSRVSLLVTSAEEIGSPTGRRFVEDAARRSRAVLVLEPSAGGALKTSRKGVSMYRLHVTGRAAHAGLEPEREINALVELATQVHRIVELGRPSAGTTVTPTTAKAGTTRNTVPAQAELAIDVRAETAAELTSVNDALRTFTAAGDARLRLEGGINRARSSPPRPRICSLASRCAAHLGLPPLTSASVGGGSDGNFTAGIGVPTLDGIGAVGYHAHAEGEYVELDAMTERPILLTRLIIALDSGEDTGTPNRSDTR